MEKSIGSAIPYIIGLLCHRDSGVRITGAELLQDLCKIYLIPDLNVADEVIALFHMMSQYIPQIIALIEVNDSYGRYGGAEALSRLSKRGKSLVF